MNKILLSICSLTLFLNCQNKAKEVSQEDNRPTYSDTICFRPATLEEAKKLMLTEDSYILNRSFVRHRFPPAKSRRDERRTDSHVHTRITRMDG